ncbi:MAG: hypothetical protein HZB51_02980 [Chloroflexi bacterium]|nr:hypothetical protein [Chloroflexota bacterium]
MKPRNIFLARLWAFLNYRTTVGLTWLEILTASGVGLLIVWISLHDWTGISVFGPLAMYALIAGFYREWRIPIGWLRKLYYRLYKPLTITQVSKRQTNIYALVLFAAAIFITVLTAFFDWRIAALLGLIFAIAAVLLWAIHDRETRGGKIDLNTVAARVPISAISKDGDIVHPDGTRSRISIIALGRSGYKPALQAVDVADMLTKFLAHLAQRAEGAVPIKLFWITDYHLGQLDLSDPIGVDKKYLQELRALAQSGARKARVVLTCIVYPTQLETSVREWLAQLDFSLAPLGAFAAESLIRMLMGGESFLAQIQQATLSDGHGLPPAAYRGFIPEEISFDSQIKTNRNVLNVLRINTPFPVARDAIMRALQSVDGMVTITLMPLPRDKSATDLRGRILAARVPGLGRWKQAQAMREILKKLEDRRSLEYLFDTQTHFITWGQSEKEAQKNQTLAMTYLTAIETTPLTNRALDSLENWMPVLSVRVNTIRFSRWIDALVLPPPAPTQRLLTTEAISTLSKEEGSDIFLADARDRILLGRSVDPGKEGLRYVDFRSDTGPVLLVSDQGGGKTSTLIVWFILRLQILNYKIVAINLKYSNRMQVGVEKIGGIVLHPMAEIDQFEKQAREALFSNRAVIYQPVKGTRPFAIADDPCLLAFMRIFYEEWLPHRSTPAALVIDEIHRLMPKDTAPSENAAEAATLVAEAFKDWAERKLVIAAATQTLRDLLGSNLGVALQKFRTVAYFQVGPEDREMLIDKGYEPALIDEIIGGRRRARGYCTLVMPDGFYTTIRILVTDDEKEIIQRLDVEETADTTPQLEFE